jgi:hypothetical protein
MTPLSLSKYVGETLFLPSGGWDFSSYLNPGEVITGLPVITVMTYSGADASPQAILSGAPQVFGMTVRQLVTAGIAGVTYAITCKVVTNLGQTLEIVGLLAVTSETSPTADSSGVTADNGQVTADS